MSPQQLGRKLAAKLNKLNRAAIISGAGRAESPFVKPKSTADIIAEVIKPPYQAGALTLVAGNPRRSLDELLAEWRVNHPFWFYETQKL